MIRARHLSHPFRSMAAVRRQVAQYLWMRQLAASFTRRYGADPRFDLQSVKAGFASRHDNMAEDFDALRRISTAYRLAIEQQSGAPRAYEPTAWWNEIQQTSLRPAMSALQRGDLHALSEMYGNFYRDPCSAGLIYVPYWIRKARFEEAIKSVPAGCYLGEALDRIEHWSEMTGGHFSVADLSSPGVGNPFGAFVEGTLVTPDATYHHYCAQRVNGLLGTEGATVAEFGGGFGAMAHYLLRDRPGVTYLNFDLPESIALSSYYLMRSFPHLTFLLFGEKPWNGKVPAGVDVVLMPVFEMEKISVRTIDVSFSSHSISDLSDEVAQGYLRIIGQATRDCLLIVGSETRIRAIEESVCLGNEHLKLVRTQPMKWNRIRTPKAVEMESLFRICDTN